MAKGLDGVKFGQLGLDAERGSPIRRPPRYNGARMFLIPQEGGATCSVDDGFLRPQDSRPSSDPAAVSWARRSKRLEAIRQFPPEARLDGGRTMMGYCCESIYLGDALDMYPRWPNPVVIVSDGAYGVSGIRIRPRRMRFSTRPKTTRVGTLAESPEPG